MPPKLDPNAVCLGTSAARRPTRGVELSCAVSWRTRAQRSSLLCPWSRDTSVSASRRPHADTKRRVGLGVEMLIVGCVGVAVYIRVKGGEVPGGASLAPKIGPLGMVLALSPSLSCFRDIRTAAGLRMGDDSRHKYAQWRVGTRGAGTGLCC
jgi:hypothetical protein